MTDEPRRSTRPSDVSQLLLKAIDQLPEEERAVVLKHFLELGLGVRGAPSPGAALHEVTQVRALGGPSHVPGALATVFTAQKAIGPDHVMIPVRLSDAQHRRLKEWCAEHNFPMAVVVRGLVERFLDSWEKGSR